MSTSFQEISDWLDMLFATGHTYVHGLVSVEEREIWCSASNHLQPSYVRWWTLNDTMLAMSILAFPR